jgi:integrase/recombinase XerD
MSEIARAVEDYLRLRRALGFKLEREGQLLPEFVAFLEKEGQATITTDAALAWATRPEGAAPAWWDNRLSMVRGFARWLAAFEPATEVPPADLFPVPSHRAEPYPYTDHDVAALMRAARGIPSELKGATYECLIGLLAVTGLRVGEAIGLDRADIDWDGGLVVVRNTKFAKSREVPLHPSTVAALGAYAHRRDRHRSRVDTPAFFVSLAGTRLIYNNVHCTFHQLVNKVGLKPISDRCRPRIHDLRHRFAVTTLLGWYHHGEDVEARLPQLSTYLGHLAPKDTYWYLRAAPELMAMAARRLEAGEGAAS